MSGLVFFSVLTLIIFFASVGLRFYYSYIMAEDTYSTAMVQCLGPLEAERSIPKYTLKSTKENNTETIKSVTFLKVQFYELNPANGISS